MNNKSFFRKVGFGLGVNDEIPNDPLQWAMQQFDYVSDIDLIAEYTELDQLKAKSELLEAGDLLNDRPLSPAKWWEKRSQQFIKYGFDFYPCLELHRRHKAAVNSAQPSFERFYHFWTNHFAVVDSNGLTNYGVGPFQRNTIRNNLTGSFANLVKEVTVSFAMLESLNNGDSVGENSKANKKTFSNHTKEFTLNENHARELLELHTVSPKSGYTQQDVIELSKIMTGWKPRYRKGDYVHWKKPVRFDNSVHEPGKKTVLTKVYDNLKPDEELFAVIDDLCSHEKCVEFISTKLCKYFIDDNPSTSMVSFVVDAWKRSNGNLPTIHRAVVQAAYDNPQYNKKYLMPETWWLQIAKMMDLDCFVPNKEFQEYDFKSKPKKFIEYTKIMEDLGHHPFKFQQPNGYMSDEQEWISPEMLIRRVIWAKQAYNYMLKSITRSNSNQYVIDIINKNFDNASEIIDHFVNNDATLIKSAKFTTLFSRPEVLRV